MKTNQGADTEPSTKVTPPELQEFSELLEREALRKKLVRKNGSLNLLEKINVSLWEPKFELEDFNIIPPAKEEQLHRVRSEPMMIKEGIYMMVDEEKEGLMRGTKRVRDANGSKSMIDCEERSESSTGRKLELDLNKVVDDCF